MNPTLTRPTAQNRNLFEGAFESLGELEKAEEQNNYVPDSAERSLSIASGWESFYEMRTEVNESVVEKTEIENTRVEFDLKKTIETPMEESVNQDFNSSGIIEKQKGSGSFFEETGISLNPIKKAKEFTKNLLGVFSLFKEIFMDTVTLVVGKKDKRAEKPEADPEKARSKAEKKAENQKKQGNIKAFYDGLRSQSSSVASADILRMETQEKANINLTAKIGQESYKGIKDSFGRLTIYAASLFERAQLDQEKQAKKQEKEMKIASAGGGPDLNMDKVAEGGFLSSTGGQGAG